VLFRVSAGAVPLIDEGTVRAVTRGDEMIGYEKLRGAVRRTLITRGYLLSLEAMEFAERYHTGLRKDGSYEFSHQLEMAQLILDLPHVEQIDETLAVCFLHDVREDYGVGDDVLRDRFGARVADAVDLLTKEFQGVRIWAEFAYSRIAADPIAAVVKGADRIHNLRTMPGAFTAPKQSEYQFETVVHIRPMLLRARTIFDTRHAALTALIQVLDHLIPHHAAHPA
jgi:(p)ppGpp synthase/HD superfamily hydrolase